MSFLEQVQNLAGQQPWLVPSLGPSAVALGSLKTLNDAISVMLGVLIVAAMGELLRRVRLGEIRLNIKKQ